MRFDLSFFAFLRSLIIQLLRFFYINLRVQSSEYIFLPV